MAKASKATDKQIPLDLIDEPGGVIRLEINQGEIKELADNIVQVGLLQPVVVRPVGDRFEIVFGHRRYLAFELLDRKKIKCVVRVMDDGEAAIARASENLRRVNLSLIEEAAVYADLRDNHKLTADQIGKLTGISPGVVKRRLDLLKMPPCLQKALHLKQISFTVAEELWGIGDIDGIDYYLPLCIDHGAKRKVVRGWVKDWKDEKRRTSSAGGGGGGVPPAMQPRPAYVPCDLCLGPMEVGKETLFRCCPGCVETIKKALHAPGE